MKIYRYETAEHYELGALARDGRLLPLSQLGCRASDLMELMQELEMDKISSLEEELKQENGVYHLDAVSLSAPFEGLRQHVICVENNFCRDEAEWQGFHNADPSYPRYTFKRAYRLNPPGGEIPSYPSYVEGLDCGAELAAIVGREAKRVPPEEIEAHLFGYTVINDVMATNLAQRHRRAFLAKSLDGFLPMGPCIVTANEFCPAESHTVRTIINGQCRRSGDTRWMRFSPEDLASQLSQGMTLCPGTVIACGASPLLDEDSTNHFLHAGDRVECEIEGIGKLANPVR